MKRFILKILGYGFIAICGINLIAFASLYVLGKSSFYKPLFVANYEQQDFDYIVLGSSTGLTTLNTVLIDSITGYSGLNVSIDDTSLSSHYIMLKHFIESGKKSERCVLTVGYGDIANDMPSLSGNDYRFLPFIREPYIEEYYNNFDTEEARLLAYSKYLPFLGVSYFNAEIFYPSLLSLKNPDRRNRFDNRGNYVYPSSRRVADRADKKIQLEIRNPYFDKIVALCNQNKMQLILYHPPIYKRDIVAENVPYTFVNHSSLLESPTYFYDNIHVNKNGRRLATQAFAIELKP